MYVYVIVFVFSEVCKFRFLGFWILGFVGVYFSDPRISVGVFVITKQMRLLSQETLKNTVCIHGPQMCWKTDLVLGHWVPLISITKAGIGVWIAPQEHV